MEILLSHHFWHDNKNAVWNPSLFPYPQIEQKLKESYVVLEAERPAWKKYDNITVFFDYRPGKDAYGRDIVPISFAFVPNCLNPKACQSVIAPLLCRITNNVTKIDLDFPPESIYIPKVPKPISPLKIILVLSTLLPLFFIWFYFFGNENEQYQGYTDKIGALDAIKEENVLSPKFIEVIKNELSEQELTKSENDKQNKETPSYLCEDDKMKNFLENSLFPCPKQYFTAICSGEIKKNISFEEWLTKEGKNCNYRGGLLYKRTLKDEDKKELKKFFKNIK